MTGPIRIGPQGISRHLVQFPDTKPEIELFIAKLFCAGNAGLRPQITRYGSFTNLEQQAEDRPDFRVRTGNGDKWLELAEFAPLDQFGKSYESVPASWDASVMLAAIRKLVDKKAAKGYGSDVILLIYKTHETLAVPPPILRALTADLTSAAIPFESIYFVSPHDEDSASAWEIYPGDTVDERWMARTGSFHVGFGGMESPSDGADQASSGGKDNLA